MAVITVIYTAAVSRTGEDMYSQSLGGLPRCQMYLRHHPTFIHPNDDLGEVSVQVGSLDNADCVVRPVQAHLDGVEADGDGRVPGGMANGVDHPVAGAHLENLSLVGVGHQ